MVVVLSAIVHRGVAPVLSGVPRVVHPRSPLLTYRVVVTVVVHLIGEVWGVVRDVANGGQAPRGGDLGRAPVHRVGGRVGRYGALGPTGPVTDDTGERSGLP